jgi:LuxR family maltose regulon positive regulatory protein
MWQGDWPQAFAYAQKALERLPEHDVNWRGISLLVASGQELHAGNIDAAQRMAMEARVLCEAAQNIHGASAAMLALAEAYAAQTELDQAEEIYRQVLSAASNSEELLDDRGSAQLGLGAIAFERNDLALAEQYATQALEIARRRSDEEMRVLAALVLARVQYAHGQKEQAQEMLRSLAAQTHRALMLRQVLAWRARFSLDAGDLAAAQRWRATHAQHADNLPKTQQEQEALILARLHLAAGESEAALKLLERWRRDAHAHGRTRSELEILGLEALAHAAQADTRRAHKALARALALAQPGGYRRVFLDEGEKMATVLQTVLPDLSKRPLALYATLLLRAFASASRAAMLPAPSPLVEPLSPQEQRVLRLLAAGLSNREIARELIVSANTIKTQVKSIYRKLNVNSRDEARELARQLNLR